jgi:hypothetical protein
MIPLGSVPFGTLLDELYLLEFINTVLTGAGLEHEAAVGADAFYAGLKNPVFIAEFMVSLTAVQTLAVETVHLGAFIGREFHITYETLYDIAENGIAVKFASGYVLE